MADVVELDTDVPFDCSHWIDVGKIYKDVPEESSYIRNRILGTRVDSEQTREPEINVEYLGGKFSLNHAAHQLKEGIQQSEGLRTDTTFQKARYHRWIASGKPVEWRVGCRLDVALSDLRGDAEANGGVGGT
ncbi:hypothetical protein B0H10DRAFT_1943966 [Mycena sp. CBHHK59/15]|nr:hypothetical protein B0H10DRAFT_1943966 [Mycena sp. CBHHK59/15]